MKYEHCCECDAHTGRAGRADDSLYAGDWGPYCEDCWGEVPEKLVALMATLEAQLAAERADADRLITLLPGTIYLDPPDGGSVTIFEQFQRMALDAERYRWGIKNARWIRHEHEAYVAIPVALDADLSCVAMRHAAIDAALQATAPEQEGE